jgi:broad specificity phosphatase PhoE
MMDGKQGKLAEWVKNKYDCPITELGLKQAKRTGQYLKELFTKDNLKFDKIIIECSPFLRCQMTAAQIATELGIHNFKVNYQFTEELCKSWCQPKNPMPGLDWVKAAKFDFEALRKHHADAPYQYFPAKTVVSEPDLATTWEKNYRDMMFAVYPENSRHGFTRHFHTCKYMSDRVL